MTDLEKNKAIYKAMKEIANEVFANAAKASESLRAYIKENGNPVSLADIIKRNSAVYCQIADVTPFNRQTKEGIRTIEVDTFSCEFPPMQVFDLLKTFKSLAKESGDVVFTYEEEIKNEFVGTIELTFEKPANAKAFCNFADKDPNRDMLGYILVEVNTESKDISIVASNGAILAVMSQNPQSVWNTPDDLDANYQALFSPVDWKRICDHAKKFGSVSFKLYRKNGEENQDTMIADINGNAIKSSQINCRYPNWRSVLPKGKYKHFKIKEEDSKAAQKWLKSFKAEPYETVNVSFYKGSDLVYFDYKDLDFGIEKSISFRLEEPSDETIGVFYRLNMLRSTLATGFYIVHHERATYLDSPLADILLIMPCLSDDNIYVRKVEEREVCIETEVIAA